MSMSTPEQSPERKSKMFWAATDQWEIKQVTGYECSQNWDVWWVPELGYSLSTKHHLFQSAQAARSNAIKKLQKEIDVLQSALSRLHLENQ